MCPVQDQDRINRMWGSLVSNKEVVKGLFGEHPPSNEYWRLVSISLEASDSVYIVLEKTLDGQEVPKRWVSKNWDTVQLRFFLYSISDIEIKGGLKNALCAFSISNEKFEVERYDGADHFLPWIRIECKGVKADFFPYRLSEYDAPPKWLR